MGDQRSLDELWAIVRNGEPRDMISSKPFRPCRLHVIVAILAPKFYTEEQLLQLENFCNQTTKNDLIHKRSHQEEEMAEEEIAKQMNKKTRKKMIVSRKKTSKFLMDKQLYNSDICRSNNRLSMPENKIMCDFLTEDEMEILGKREGSKGRLQGVEVTLLDPCLREFTLILKKWEMRSITYNLVKDWKRVVADNKLQEKLKIWSFRVDKMLYFIFNKV